VRAHCEAFDSTRKLLAQCGIRSQVVYRTDQDDRALALVGAGLGVTLMPAIFDAPNVKKVPIRDFDAKRVISLHWNEDVADDRLDRLVTFCHHTQLGIIRSIATSRLFGDHLVTPPAPNLIALAFRFDRLGRARPIRASRPPPRPYAASSDTINRRPAAPAPVQWLPMPPEKENCLNSWCSPSVSSEMPL
jgi:hypothetical protein